MGTISDLVAKLQDNAAAKVASYIGGAAPKALQYVTRITIDSEYLPSFVIDKPFDASSPAPDNRFLQALKPRITFELAGGSMQPIVLAPYGEPGPTHWPQVRTGFYIGAALLVGLGIRALVRARRR